MLLCVVVYLRRSRKDRSKNGILKSKSCGFKTARHVCKVKRNMFDHEINPILNSDDLIVGTRMGMDSHADTRCVSKHAYVESIVEGFTVDTIPFDKSIGKMSDLPIVNTIYAFDDPEA